MNCIVRLKVTQREMNYKHKLSSRRLQPAWNCQRAEHYAHASRRLKSAATGYFDFR